MTTKAPEGTASQSTRHMSGGFEHSKEALRQLAQALPPHRQNREMRRQIKKGQR